jgi:hypothetical protein
MKKPAQHLIAEVPRRQAKVEMTIGIDLGDVWSHYCTLNQDGEVVDRGRFRTTPKAIEKWFTDVAPARVAMEAGTHSIWVSAQLQELGHEVIVANVRELRAISHSDRKSDQVDAEKLARYARLDPNILRPITHRTVEQQQALTLIRARALLEHAQTLLPEDIPRFAKLHIIASVQPFHAIDDGRWAKERIGAERIKTTYAFRSLMNSGAVVAFGSDWPVAPLVPLTGIYAAVTRRTIDGKNPNGWMPQEKVTVAQAVRSYTYNAAYAEGEETLKGTIQSGQLADIIVLSQDIFQIDPAEIENVRVDLTLLGGAVVYDRTSPH